MLPDITVLGPYTYLATEVVFGSVAAALLWRAGAGRRAARTIAALYPVAYVWDWYTLEVGVFSIPMRTGATFLGIPVEEHLFIVVVPAFVLGIHETLHGDDPAAEEGTQPSAGAETAGAADEGTQPSAGAETAGAADEGTQPSPGAETAGATGAADEQRDAAVDRRGPAER